MSDRERSAPGCATGKPLNEKTISDEDIYLMVMLHQYQHMSCEKIARRFGVSSGRVYDIIAKRANSGCCG